MTASRGAMNSLLDETDEPVADEIREILDSHGDVEIADLHVWQIGPQARAAIVRVRTHGGIKAETIHARLAPVHVVMHLTVEASS